MIEDYLQDQKPRYHPYKSLPEHRIGSLLDQYGLPFVYEKPTAIVDRGQVRIWYPDFTLSYGTVIEYFGVNGDAGYRQRTQHKLAVYEQNQIAVLPVYPTNLGSGWEHNLLHRIDSALERHLCDYRSRVIRDYSAAPAPRPARYRVH
jgi:hypothetical protein